MCHLSNNLFRFSGKIASVGICHKLPLQLHKNKSLHFGWSLLGGLTILLCVLLTGNQGSMFILLFWEGYQKLCMWQYRKVWCAVLSSMFYKFFHQPFSNIIAICINCICNLLDHWKSPQISVQTRTYGLSCNFWYLALLKQYM